MSALSDWLANPTVHLRISPSEEMEALKKRNEFLENELLRLQSLYGRECNISMRLQELLASHGIKWR